MLGKFLNRRRTNPEKRAETNADLASSFFLTELSMAFEKKGVFEYLERHPGASASEIASALGLRKDLFEAASEFLAERGVFSKSDAGHFSVSEAYRSIRRPANFLLAYKDVFESSAELMDGSRRYGKDVDRDASRLGFATERAIPYLIERFRELGLKSALDIGCGTGNFLFALAEAIPGFSGTGIEIDTQTVEKAKKKLLKSRFKNSIEVFQGDAAQPAAFCHRVPQAETLIGTALFHEFRKAGNLVPLLKQYKKQFPASKFFLIEFDAPEWDELRAMPDGTRRNIASHYRLVHYFSEQGLPQSKSAWMQTLRESGWDIVKTSEIPIVPLVVFECE